MTTTRPLRVALVVDTLDRGGAERVLVTLARSLDRDRVQPLVIETRAPGPLGEELPTDVPRHCLRRSRRWDAAALRRFARLTGSWDVDLVHSFNHTTSYFVRLARALGSARWRHVVHDHHGPVEEAVLLRLLDRLLLRGVDAWVAVSSRLAAYAVQGVGLPVGRVSVIENGIALPPVVARDDRAGFRVVQVGRIVPEKDHATSLRAAARLQKSVSGLSWVFVGRREDSPAWRTVAALVRDLGLEGVVTFVGEQADVSSWLRDADAFVLTSRHEGLPLALLEAMAWGLPVVVTNVGACGALVDGSGGGAVANVGDDEAIAEALGGMARDPARRREAGSRNREWVTLRHGEKRMAEAFSELYERLAGGDPVTKERDE